MKFGQSQGPGGGGGGGGGVLENVTCVRDFSFKREMKEVLMGWLCLASHSCSYTRFARG